MNIHSIVNISKVPVCFILVYVVSSNEGSPAKFMGKDTRENMGLWEDKTGTEAHGQQVSPFTPGQACRPSLRAFFNKTSYLFSQLPVTKLAKDTRDSQTESNNRVPENERRKATLSKANQS